MVAIAWYRPSGAISAHASVRSSRMAVVYDAFKRCRRSVHRRAAICRVQARRDDERRELCRHDHQAK
jgi:hypothetical protein